ncbi:adipocyte plasma membrane-associated protein [Plakobranchus ocellatus]|uniref:Adipocyte plasma membrane-associated protein n=1 Tax=Plakobranchus ocellatus TaxID=259542 RepID=A0AAV4CRN2_9GAST|nr:adipocyte plasma membrane-associated protein [Plakobranchus ocellatus]
MDSKDARQRRPHKGQSSEGNEDSKMSAKERSSQRWVGPFFTALLVSLVALVVGFILMPSPVDPVKYQLPEPPELVGPLAPNNILQHAERLYSGKLDGPESIVVDGDHIYVGTADGWVNDIYKGEIQRLVRFGKGPCGGIENENTCGRPLGMRMDKNGFLIVVDAYYGLFQVNVATGDYVTLFSSSTLVEGKPVKLVNDLDIAPDGKIYFTHTSTRWHRNQFPMIFLEGNTDGRLLVYDPKTEGVSVVMDGLLFANGVQFSKDKSAVLVVETIKARVWKYDIKTGKASVWADNLPGFPDNIRYSKFSGTYWIGIAIVRQKGRSMIDTLAPMPWLRGHFAKVASVNLVLFMNKFFGRTDTTAVALEMNENGDIIRSIQDTTGKVIERISEVESSDGVLYFGSFNLGYLGRLYTKRVPGF